jgi:hypothetical protein
MKLLLVTTVVLASLANTYSQPDVQLSTGQGGASSAVSAKCSKTTQNFKLQSKQFLNCLGQKISKELDKVKTTRRNTPAKINNYAKTEQLRVQKVLKGVGCQRDVSRDISTILRVDLKASKVIYNDIATNLQKVIWQAAKSPTLSGCFLNWLRDQFLKYIRDCSGLNIPVGKADGLDDVPTMDAVHYNIPKAREVVETHLKGYLLAYACGKTNAVKGISQVARADVCQCAKREFSTRACHPVVTSACGDVQSCIRDIFTKGKKLFDLSGIGDRAKLCWNRYKKSKEAKSTKLTDLVDPGLALTGAFNRLTKKDIKEGTKMIQAFLDAQFSTGFCEGCFGGRKG